jgi:hypothetical protein
MMKGAEGRVTKHADMHLDFIKNSIFLGRPANLVIVLDTHSDTFSGQLQATGGLTGNSTTLTLPDLVRSYVGDDTLQEMVNASRLARTYNFIPEISPGVAPWADITPKARGGWRVMIMVSCGSAVRIPMHWEYITHLFTK